MEAQSSAKRLAALRSIGSEANSSDVADDIVSGTAGHSPVLIPSSIIYAGDSGVHYLIISCNVTIFILQRFKNHRIVGAVSL